MKYLWTRDALMTDDRRRVWDAILVLLAITVFALPFTLLVPDFSILDVIPKVQITRFHIFTQHLTWSQLNITILSLTALFFVLYLELRKRKLDDMVVRVLMIDQTTDSGLAVEGCRQATALQACKELLDTSAEHYENLVLLRDELRVRRRVKQHPPVIEPSGSNVTGKQL